jgi:hypothetical protein
MMIAAAIGCTLFSTPAMTTASLCLGWAGLAMHTFGYNVSSRDLLLAVVLEHIGTST